MGLNQETILDEHAFLVSETDESGVIVFANDYFCDVAEYPLEELLDKNHNIVRHPDMPKVAFKDLWDTIRRGDIWTGYVKNRTKSGGYYWVFATVYPFESCGGKKGYLSCRRKANNEEIKTHEELYKELIKQEKRG
jgi:aerotaxis receptor